MAFQKGKKHSEETRRKIRESLKGKGIGKWNIGRIASDETRKKMSASRKGKLFTKEHKVKLSESKKGNKNPWWKGNNVGYKSLHQWVVRELGVADICSICKSPSNVEWANTSHKYKRNLIDWIKLCKKCHWKYDQEKWGEASKLFIKKIGGLGRRV